MGEVSRQSPNVIEQVSALRDLHRCLVAGKPVPPETASRIAEGLGECLAALEAGETASLDAALGLKRRGGVVLRKALANDERDKLLRGLWREHPEWANRTPSYVSHEMFRAFGRYESGRWLRDRKSPDAPAVEPYATFWRLLKFGCQVPGPKRLFQILTMEIQYPV